MNALRKHLHQTVFWWFWGAVKVSPVPVQVTELVELRTDRRGAGWKPSC